MNTIQKWVSNLKASYPELPETLEWEIEEKNILLLSRWFDNIAQLRIEYDAMDKEDLPIGLQNETGKRQIIPVLMSIDTMLDVEVKAWHELFVCLSAQMADIAHNYWKAHSTGRPSISLEDILGYLPVVFLYVLSSYNPYPDIKDHENTFSENSDGRVKLITWVHIECRRHINTYLQQYTHVIKRGSGYQHRLRQKIVKIQQTALVSTGEELQIDAIVKELSKDSFAAQSKNEETLRGHVEDIILSSNVLSLDSPIDSDNDSSISDLLAHRIEDIEEEFWDIDSYMQRRFENKPEMLSIWNKLSKTDNTLKFKEKYQLGT